MYLTSMQLCWTKNLLTFINRQSQCFSIAYRHFRWCAPEQYFSMLPFPPRVHLRFAMFWFVRVVSVLLCFEIPNVAHSLGRSLDQGTSKVCARPHARKSFCKQAHCHTNRHTIMPRHSWPTSPSTSRVFDNETLAMRTLMPSRFMNCYYC